MKKTAVWITAIAAIAVAVRLTPREWRARVVALTRVATGPASSGPALPPGAAAETITCWYPPKSGLEPVAEERRIPACATPQERLSRALAELHHPPTGADAEPALPAGLAPRAVFLAADGTAYVDLPGAAFERPLGPRDELVLLRSIARTCLSNVPEARALVVLADGAPRLSLFGHFPGSGRYLLPRTAPERGTKRGRAAPR